MSHPLYEILSKLDAAHIFYTLARYRDDYVTIHITVPGRRYEVEVTSAGEIVTACFSGNEDVNSGIEEVEKILGEFGGE